MTDIITDYAAIAKIARLKALDGRPQDDVTAGIAPQVAPPEPAEGWHVYWQENLYGKVQYPHYPEMSNDEFDVYVVG